MAFTNYTDLKAWQLAMRLVVGIYEVTETFPRREMFALSLQLRRTAVSIPSNIAEGQGRSSPAAFRNHLSIALGSLNELETQIQIAERLGYVDFGRGRHLLGIAQEIGRLINGLRNAAASHHGR